MIYVVDGASFTSAGHAAQTLEFRRGEFGVSHAQAVDIASAAYALLDIDVAHGTAGAAVIPGLINISVLNAVYVVVIRAGRGGRLAF
jgi:hypothetical protein